MTTSSSVLSQLQFAALLEGVTLLALLGIAVPLKHLAGIPNAVSIAGPVHGLAFLFYLWQAMNAATSDSWPTRTLMRVLAAAFVPFGFISTLNFIRKQRALSAATAA
ncbi:DUF3817 domain-containing protein [Steroidobacter sp.]|uniref:DUF3817 domain-containing protein n=1 Tax=Steroidobacter sp. TaxID=1978227 RepID=UPI001A61E4EA|nr:DUF3817 domain-containing protein [Steroidobacter sp.]MBL8265841.1 DUF3817 domain-containing protein [Steroidobacter sp.]